jgi:hypothetical protein
MWELYDPQKDCVLTLHDAQGYELGVEVEINGVDYAVAHVVALREGGSMVFLKPVHKEHES